MDQKTQEIIRALEEKASTKQYIFRKTIDIFEIFKTQIKSVSDEVAQQMKSIDSNVAVSSKNNGDFEAELKFSADTLMFIMHTNVFNFPPEHSIHKTEYVREDPMRAYCGMIMIYDFLSDSIKYGRMSDIGYLIARIFINKEGHFFVQGKRQFSFLYNDFSTFEITPEIIRLIVQTAMLHTIDFDLFVPPFDAIKEVTLMQKFMEAGNAAVKTGKRLGFNYAEND
ncbi:MAG: hypothetical protein EOP53_24435 [Sphingobacteriales bacterium]|nr:MAG: hypothetical protein EOP53_24435 [Sphingobacteriales bacterium]